MNKVWTDKFTRDPRACEVHFHTLKAHDKAKPGEHTPRNKNLSEPLADSQEGRYNKAKAAWLTERCR